ncbi:hypothetical protein MLD52_12785 [Puniceicoccaceae bacterium K14]|nr:hypothetical protein [Puniceicoccaceae bacterium K14]
MKVSAFNKKILIIREDEHRAKALSFILSGTGFRTSFHGNTDEALGAVQSERFDLAIVEEMDGLIAGIKKSQPRLPIFLLANEKNLDNIIESIRFGVTDIIEGFDDLKGIAQQAHNYLRPESSENEVTASDLIEVEQALNSLNANSTDENVSNVSNIRIDEITAELKKTLKQNEELNAKLETAEGEMKAACERYEELRSNSSENGEISSERLAKLDDVEERERELVKRETKLAKQKSDLETQLGELETQRYELEEKIEQAGIGGIDNSELEKEIEELKKSHDQMLLKSNERRLEQDACIQDLERELVKAESKQAKSNEFEALAESLKSEIADLEQKASELDFVVSQKDEQIESLKQSQESSASNAPLQEELEEQKRLLHIEAFKLKEKQDRFELERSDFEKDHEKRLRELQVERRDAEISLREMQAQIKEEQLKYQVEKASFDDDKRQFGHAQENFQEDVQNLQRQQRELVAFEQELKRMKEQLQETQDAATTALPESPAAMSETIMAPPVQQPESAPQKPSSEKGTPDNWSKPAIEKKGRGPLRIGRRSSF